MYSAAIGFERKTGIKVKATFGSGAGTKQQVARGEPFDVPIVQPPYPDVLASGNVVASSATPLASVSVGLAVRKGAPKPDISTPEALSRTLLAAKSIAYPDPDGGAAAGVSFEETLKKLGIAQQIQPKIKRAQGGAAAELSMRHLPLSCAIPRSIRICRSIAGGRTSRARTGFPAGRELFLLGRGFLDRFGLHRPSILATASVAIQQERGRHRDYCRVLGRRRANAEPSRLPVANVMIATAPRRVRSKAS
jgi:hypothetical protein